jgi:LysR family transcriptional regulator (chromosome initiation inhibitor)
MQFSRELLATLDAIASTGSFETAATALAVTPSAVSQRVRGFERSLGRILVVRSRPATLTDDGAALLGLARQVAILEHEAAATMGLDEHSGMPMVPIAVNADSLATWLLPPIAAAASEFGAVVDLHRDDQDHTERLLASGTVVAAVTTRADPIAGCIATPLGRMTYRPVAAPDFVTRWFPVGITVDALARAPIVDFDRKDDLQSRGLDTMTRAAGAESPTKLNPPRSFVPASADFVAAVELGLGWAMVPDVQARAARRDGGLVDLAALLPTAADCTIDVPLHWQQWDLRSSTLDGIAAAVLDRARAELGPIAPSEVTRS